jgi:hypothetical protein
MWPFVVVLLVLGAPPSEDGRAVLPGAMGSLSALVSGRAWPGKPAMAPQAANRSGFQSEQSGEGQDACATRAAGNQPSRPDSVAGQGLTQRPPRSGPELREAVRAALRRWARPSDAEADEAARQFLALYQELQDDGRLARRQRASFLGKVRFRLVRLSDQISKRIARQKRQAESREPKTVDLPEEKAETLAQRQGGAWGAAGPVPGMGPRGPGLGGGAYPTADYGQQLVDLIQRVIRPDTWDINGGHGTIFYWRPGRALVVRQTGEVHEQLGDALKQLRRAGR